MEIKNKKESIYLLVIILLVALCAQFYYSFKYEPEHRISVYYSYDEKLNQQIIEQIKNADKFVYFAIYTFTRDDIKNALLGAKYKGLTVIGITDRQQLAQIDTQKSIIKELRDNGIPVYEQDHTGIMHMKVVVTDKSYASGSYNWTAAATNINDEILEVGKDENIRQKYEGILKEIFNKYKTTNSQ